MAETPLKVKNRIITSFLNGKSEQEISLEERVSISAVKEAIDEWESGYFAVPSINDISPELREIAQTIRKGEISINDLIEGYHYHEIFNGKERDRVIRIVGEIYSMDDEKRKNFFRTVDKMISLVKFEKIEYTEIPRALEHMVERGKSLQKEIRSREIENIELSSRNSELQRGIEALQSESASLRRELEFAKYLQEVFRRDAGSEERLRGVIEGLLHSGYDAGKIEEVSLELKSIKEREMTVEQFLRVARYFEELMKMGLTSQMMSKLLDRLKEDSIDVGEYLEERYAYVRDKAAYIKAVKDLVDTHKRLEREIKALEEEIARRKLKLER